MRYVCVSWKFFFSSKGEISYFRLGHFTEIASWFFPGCMAWYNVCLDVWTVSFDLCSENGCRDIRYTWKRILWGLLFSLLTLIYLFILKKLVVVYVCSQQDVSHQKNFLRKTNSSVLNTFLRSHVEFSPACMAWYYAFWDAWSLLRMAYRFIEQTHSHLAENWW